ncbi:MAG: tetratricopeptide (TPR) repeat protein [Crocinitomix sp.]|jgi:tetratricopeptide (TPR) repeat protein
MKSLILLLFTGLAAITFAQTDKYTPKLSDLYQKKDFAKIIKFKAGKEDQMASKSIYYKAMAYYMTDQDRQSITYFTKAIDKGPADQDMYYYRGMARYFSKKFESSLSDFDKAITLAPEYSDFYSGKAYSLIQLDLKDSALIYLTKATKLEDCEATVFAITANLHQEKEEYKLAISHYKKAISMVEVKTDKHERYNYNLGLTLQKKGDYFDAKTLFRDHIKLYPNDYHAIAKLIQIKYALNEWLETDDLKRLIYDGHKDGKLPSHMSRMYCFDQFKYQEMDVMAFESFDFYPEEILKWKHKFIIDSENDSIVYKLYTILDTIDTAPDTEVYQITLLKDDTLYSYDHFYYLTDSDYSIYKMMLMEVLDGKATPINKIGNYEEWHNNEMAKLIGDMGSSAETAIVVASVSEEYQWLRKYYPGYEMIMQSLVSENGKPYDILNFKTADGITKSVYFDISSFFGKW